jgi:hypothetical protein
LRFKQ